MVTQDDFTIEADGSAPGAYESIFEQTWYIDTYIGLATSRILISSLLFMTFFEFSAKLSMFYEVIKSSLVDIIFFVVIFFFNNAMFALIAYLLFGMTEDSVESLQEALFTCFLITVGEISPLNWVTTLTDLKTLYSCIFTLNKVFLLNMFIAVITAHYIEFYVEVEEGNSLVSLVIEVIKRSKPPQPDSDIYKNAKWYEKLQYRLTGILYV